MVKTKEKYKKVDLRVLKNKNRIDSKLQQKNNDEKDIFGEIQIEELHKKGVIINADFSKDDFGEVTYVKLYADSGQSEIITKKMPMQRLNTNGIGRWNYRNEHKGANNKKSYEVFYPKEQSANVLIGEVVTIEAKDTVILGVSSINRRIEQLCLAMQNVSLDDANIIKNSAIELMQSYLFSVIKKSKLIPRDREYIMGRFSDIKELPSIQIPSKFKELKNKLQILVSQDKMERKMSY